MSPSPMAYHVADECLIADHGRLVDAIELKDEMLDFGFVDWIPKSVVRLGDESYNEVSDVFG